MLWRHPKVICVLNCPALALQLQLHGGAAVTRIDKNANRTSEIIDRIRSFYRKAPPKRELVAINEVIGEMAGKLGSEARRHGVSIYTDIKDDLPMIVADRVQLQQVLMNLMLNAALNRCQNTVK